MHKVKDNLKFPGKQAYRKLVEKSSESKVERYWDMFRIRIVFPVVILVKNDVEDKMLSSTIITNVREL